MYHCQHCDETHTEDDLQKVCLDEGARHAEPVWEWYLPCCGDVAGDAE